MAFYVYLMASRRNGTLYLGVTNDLGGVCTSTKQKRSQASHLVTAWTVLFGSNPMTTAITRDKELKKWRRAWKIRLIEESNPNWRDLYDDIKL
jgi:putative endonuclease